MSIFTKIKSAFATDAGVDPQLENSFSMQFPMFGSYNPNSLTKEDYLRNYYRGRSFVAVSTIATSFASLDYALTSKSGKAVEDKRMDLLSYNLFLNIASYLKLNGNCYVWKNMINGKIIGLVVLRPDLVETKLNSARTRVESYKYNNKTFPKEDIMHFAQFNPLFPHPTNIDGIGDVQAVAMTIDGDQKAAEWNRRFFDNSARPDGFLSTDQALNSEASKKLQDKREEKYRGLQNSQKVAVLTGGLKYIPLSPGNKEMDFVEGRRLNRDEILGIYKVPKALLGLGDGGQTLNIGKFERIFAKQVMHPLAKQIQGVITNELFGGDFSFQFINVVPFDQLEMRNNYVVDGITLNEFRKSIGFPELDGGDKFRSDVVAGEATVAPEKSYQKIVAGAMEGAVDEDFREKLKSASKKSVKSFEKGTEEYREKKREEKIERNNKYEKEYSEKLTKIFNRQEKEIMAEYKKRYKTKAVKANKPALDVKKWSIVYYDLLKSTQESLVQTEGTKALVEVGIGTPAVVTTPETQKLLKDNINKWSLAVDEVTNAKLVKDFEVILNQGLTVEEGSTLIGKRFTELKTSRLKNIVRTETIRAGNFGSTLGYEQSGVVEEKQRYTALDERVCSFCGPEHGKIVALDKTFYKKGDTARGVDENGKTVTMKLDYGDVGFPPLHVNCRCSILPIIK